VGRGAASATASEPTSYIALGAAARIPASPLFVGFPNDRWFVLPFMFVFVFVVVGVSRRNQVVHDEGPFTAEHRLRPEAQNAILATYRNVKSIIGGPPTAGIEIKPSIARQIELY
jgi:hypothetical protein